MTGFRLLILGAALTLALTACGRDEFLDYVPEQGPDPQDCTRDSQCPENQFCDRGTCRDEIVDPPDCRIGAFRCLDRDTVGFCPDGDGFEVWEDCGADGGFCDAGQCFYDEPECRRGAVRCGPSGNPEFCEGERWRDLGSCPPNSRCIDGDCVREPGELPDIVPFADAGPREVPQVGSINVSLEVINDGNGRAGQFDCDVHLTQGEPQPRFDLLLERIRFGPMGPFEGEGVGLRVQLGPEVQPGPYLAYVACDVRNDVRESNENNNLAIAGEIFVTPDEPQVDFEIIDINIRANDRVEAGDSLTADIVVCNFGNAPAPRTSVRLHAVDEPDSDRVSQLLGEWNLNRPPGPGDCTELTVQTEELECFEPELFFVRGIVDPRNQVPESNERNNTFGGFQPLELRCPEMDCVGDDYDPENPNNPPTLESDLPNELILCPMDVDTFALPWQSGQSGFLVLFPEEASLNVRIQAIQGDVLTLLASGNTEEEGIFEFNSDELPDADRFQLSVSGGVPPQGARYQVLVSGGDVMPEGPDLNPSAITISAAPFRPGDNVNFQYTVRNRGDRRADRTFVGVGIVEGRVRNPEQDEIRFLGRAQLGVLDGGESESGRIIGRLPDNLRAGTYTAVVFADLNGQVVETNENNNAAGTFFDIVGDEMCEPDQFEPNNTFGQAVELEPGEYDPLVVCGGDDDFYRFCPAADGPMTISVRFEHRQGDIDLELLDERRQVIERRNGVDDEERLDLDVEGGQCYILRVFLFGLNAGINEYVLDVEFNNDGGDECSDPFEPNNGFEAPTPLDEAVETGSLDFCPQADPDFYVVPLARGETLTLGVQPETDDPGSISVTVYGPNRGFLLQRFEREPVITYEAAADGDHFVRLVTSSGEERFPYAFTEFSIE